MKKKIFMVILLCTFIIILTFLVTPKPAALIVRKLFEGGIETLPPKYAVIQNKVTVKKNISYESKYPNGYLDIYYPKTVNNQTRTIIWQHGGAYVGGDKLDLTKYATQLAANNYIVISLNYGLAPENNYPIPLIQIGEAYSFLKKKSKEWDINLEKLYFAGDSAGAQMISQFITAQSNKTYADVNGIAQEVPIENIAGVLLFCGPYDLQKLGELEQNNILLHFFIKRIGWSYLGEYNWENSKLLKQADIFSALNSKFPPTFITDGNVGSFETQGKSLALELKKQSVEVVSVFYNKNESLLKHEYQFEMDTKEGQETFAKVLLFLKNKD